MSEKKEILSAPISAINASEFFKHTAITMGFDSLEEILKIKLVNLIPMEGFSYKWLKEYLEILDKHGLMELL